MDKNKFLNDDNIIKIDRETFMDKSLDDIELNLYREEEENDLTETESENHDCYVHTKTPPLEKNDNFNDSVSIKYIPKSRNQLIVELIDKLESQFLIKEVETELFRDLALNNSKNTQERNINHQKILNLKEDMRLIKKKINILNGFLENG